MLRNARCSRQAKCGDSATRYNMMTMDQSSRSSASTRPIPAAALLSVLLMLACQADRFVALGMGEGNRVEASVGDRIDITLRAAALGAYASPPVISTSAIAFLEVTTPDEGLVPGGPAQRFRFAPSRWARPSSSEDRPKRSDRGTRWTYSISSTIVEAVERSAGGASYTRASI